jgi:hypothetical protein
MAPVDFVLLFAISRIYPVFGIDRFSYRFASIDPAVFNETGLAQLKSAIRHEWITLAWAIIGVVLIVWASSCAAAS